MLGDLGNTTGDVKPLAVVDLDRFETLERELAQAQLTISRLDRELQAIKAWQNNAR